MNEIVVPNPPIDGVAADCDADRVGLGGGAGVQQGGGAERGGDQGQGEDRALRGEAGYPPPPESARENGRRALGSLTRSSQHAVARPCAGTPRQGISHKSLTEASARAPTCAPSRHSCAPIRHSCAPFRHSCAGRNLRGLRRRYAPRYRGDPPKWRSSARRMSGVGRRCVGRGGFLPAQE